MPRKLSRRGLDAWFPTILRYTGWGVAIYGVFVDQGHNPALLPLAGGMIFFKTIYGDGSKE